MVKRGEGAFVTKPHITPLQEPEVHKARRMAWPEVGPFIMRAFLSLLTR